jgi:hypothetical protein
MKVNFGTAETIVNFVQLSNTYVCSSRYRNFTVLCLVNLAASLDFPRECASMVRTRRHSTLIYFTKYAFHDLALTPHDLSTCVTLSMYQIGDKALPKATCSNCKLCVVPS